MLQKQFDLNWNKSKYDNLIMSKKFLYNITKEHEMINIADLVEKEMLNKKTK